MLTEHSQQQDRRSNTIHLIDSLLYKRTEMLSLYNQLATMRPFESTAAVTDLLNEFCEILIDYTASAHFSLYRYIEEKLERRKAVMDLAEKIYPSILLSTQLIVEFNDRYVEPLDKDEKEHLDKLEADLSQLGMKMADRIELEDQLIEVLRSRKPESSRQVSTH